MVDRQQTKLASAVVFRATFIGIGCCLLKSAGSTFPSSSPLWRPKDLGLLASCDKHRNDGEVCVDHSRNLGPYFLTMDATAIDTHPFSLFFSRSQKFHPRFSPPRNPTV